MHGRNAVNERAKTKRTVVTEESGISDFSSFRENFSERLYNVYGALQSA